MITKNMPMEEYKKIDAVHKSMFWHILRSGLQFKHYIDHGEEETDVMRFGNLVDCLLLEQGKYQERYIVTPDVYPAKDGDRPWNWNANYCKEWRSNMPKEISIISSDDLDRAFSIVRSIKNHPLARQWLSGAEYQVSMQWVDPVTGISCKGRTDILRSEERIIDLKITHDCHPAAFSKILNNFLYHAGAAFYHDGYFLSLGHQIPEGGPALPCSFIVAEDKPPFDVVCYDLGVDSFEVGREICRRALDRYAEYKDTGDYSGYSSVAEEIEIPEYAIKKYQFEGVL